MADPLQSYREATSSHHPPGWRRHVTRRKVIAGSVAGAGMVWTAPSVYAWCRPPSPGSKPKYCTITYLCFILYWPKTRTKYGCLWDPISGWGIKAEGKTWPTGHCLTNIKGWSQPTSSFINYLRTYVPVQLTNGTDGKEYHCGFPGLTFVAAYSHCDTQCHSPTYTGGHYWFKPS